MYHMLDMRSKPMLQTQVPYFVASLHLLPCFFSVPVKSSRSITNPAVGLTMFIRLPSPADTPEDDPEPEIGSGPYL